jgi:hypothetical protein
MATQDSIMGLFMTPEQYQQAQRAQVQAQLMKEAELDPYERANYLAGMSGYGLGNALAGALGGQDPQLQLATARKQIMGQVDQTDPQSLAQAAQALNQAGDVQGARALAMAAQEAAVKQSQVVRNLRERPANMSELGKLQAERADLVSQFGENDPRVKQYDDKIKKLSSGKTIGEELVSGLSPLVGAIAGAQAKKAGEAGGTEVGKQTAAIQNKYTALDSIKSALDVLDKGIYSGGYGQAGEFVAKYSGGMLDKKRLANTQKFRAYIGEVVVPRLQEFGGNDSVEELKYLRSITAGDTDLEESAIKDILKSADQKIKAGIQRLQSQNQAIQTGQPLPTGPVTAPKATKRFNPTTGKVEAI